MIWCSILCHLALKTWIPKFFNKSFCNSNSRKAISSKLKKHWRNGHKQLRLSKQRMANLSNRPRFLSWGLSRKETDQLFHSRNVAAVKKQKQLSSMKNTKSQFSTKNTSTSWTKNSYKNFCSNNNSWCSNKPNANDLHRQNGRKLCLHQWFKNVKQVLASQNVWRSGDSLDKEIMLNSKRRRTCNWSTKYRLKKRRARVKMCWAGKSTKSSKNKTQSKKTIFKVLPMNNWLTCYKMQTSFLLSSKRSSSRFWNLDGRKIWKRKRRSSTLTFTISLLKMSWKRSKD